MKILLFSTPEERARGLQHTSPLKEDERALFIEPEPRTVTIHNRNVDYEIIVSFYDKNGRLLKMENLPKFNGVVHQITENDVKYIIEKTAGLSRVIPKTTKGAKALRGILASASKKSKKFVEKKWKPVDPIGLKTRRLPYIFQATEFDLRNAANYSRGKVRRLAGQVGTRPDRVVAGAADLANTALVPFGAPYVPIFKTHVAGELVAKKGVKLTKKVAPKALTTAKRIKDKATTIMYDILSYAQTLPK